MKREEIIQGNKLIALFMGGIDKDPNWGLFMVQVKNNKKPYYKLVTQMKYHSSWDWLMPVYQKINSKQAQILTPMNGIEDSITPYISQMRTMKKGAIEANLEMCFQGVIEFISWYNKNKKTHEKRN